MIYYFIEDAVYSDTLESVQRKQNLTGSILLHNPAESHITLKVCKTTS